jgi:glycosyltransferase involved in cell wall biosynthesis
MASNMSEKWPQICIIFSMDPTKNCASNSSVAVIVPIFNEAQTLRRAVEGIKVVLEDFVRSQLILVESNSNDGSREIVQEMERNWNSKIKLKTIFQESPNGKGSAVREGLVFVESDILAIFDADDEYNPTDLYLLIAELDKEHVDFVLGSRHSHESKMRIFANDRFRTLLYNRGHLLFCWIFNIVNGTRLRDPFTMWKVLKFDIVKNMRFSSNRFDFDWELLIKSIKVGATISEVPISYDSRGFAQGKKVRTIYDPLTWIYAVFKHRFSKVSYFHEEKIND